MHRFSEVTLDSSVKNWKRINLKKWIPNVKILHLIKKLYLLKAILGLLYNYELKLTNHVKFWCTSN